MSSRAHFSSSSGRPPQLGPRAISISWGALNNELASVRTVIAEVCQAPVGDDGLFFDPASVTTERIAEDAEYEGVRARFQATLGNARIAMQVDIGFSDVITPAPDKISYPSILKMPTAGLLAYNRETAIAEKFEAMVKLGELNSRMKDFFDIALLAATSSSMVLRSQRRSSATFGRRKTELQTDPICFSDRFAEEPAKAAQWKAFVRRNWLADVPAEFADAVAKSGTFSSPSPCSWRPTAPSISIGSLRALAVGPPGRFPVGESASLGRLPRGAVALNPMPIIYLPRVRYSKPSQPTSPLSVPFAIRRKFL